MIAAEEQGVNTGFNGCLGEIATSKNQAEDILVIHSIILGLGYIDKIDDKVQREVFKQGEKHGFDYGNVDVSITKGPNRNKRPVIDNLIHHI